MTINQAAGQADPTSASPINFTVTFSETVANFATGDVTLSGTAGATTATVTGSGTTYNVAVSGMTATGTVVVSVPAAAATDAAGNASLASTSTDNTVTYNAVASAPLAFVQVNAATPQTNQSVVTVTYTSAQIAGNTNILAIGWNDATSNITSVVDSAGNTYQVALPTARGLGMSQAIYYASNIKAAAAGTNTVTVTFNTSTPFVDIRVLEYSGLDPVNPFDVGTSASGNGTAANSGTVTTTAAGELIFGAGMTQGVYSAAGTNFTNRIITAQDGDIAEDRFVTATGSYSATASLPGTANWLMQVATFRAANNVDTTAPTVQSINRVGSTPTNAASVSWTVLFSESVTGVDASDFALAPTGVTGATIASVSGSGNQYTVTANTGTGSGTLGLNLVDNDTILDTSGNRLGGTGNGNGNFTGQTYTIDKTAPSVTINQAAGQTDPTSASPINFTVTFSETVANFATGDVTLSGTAGATTATVTGSGTTYNVAVSGMTAAGTVVVSVPAAAATDAAGNASLASTSTDNTVTYTLIDTAPTVQSINRVGATPTNAASVSWTVLFSESVTGVDASDFALATTGVTGATIASVSGSGNQYTVTVNTGTGNGTLGLNLVDNDTIVMPTPIGWAAPATATATSPVRPTPLTRPRRV